MSPCHPVHLTHIICLDKNGVLPCNGALNGAFQPQALYMEVMEQERVLKVAGNG
jgi:hypothetical protein